jgi:hypothetical protein
MKSKSSEMRMVYILVMFSFIFFREEGFGRETFLLFKGSSSSLGNVTLPFFCSTSTPSISPPYPHLSVDMEAVFMDALSKSWTCLVFFILLGPGVSSVVSGLSKLDISAGSAGMRRFTD